MNYSVLPSWVTVVRCLTEIYSIIYVFCLMSSARNLKRCCSPWVLGLGTVAHLVGVFGKKDEDLL
ncbi:Uncharacterized protein TCM_038033 [Theobroma cacao]|uniref:Uncharacterized protein n=1 Tax=Theobroma cacao TaxID=3641 RepID=A0A061GN94_THECC|nr:Uncharacterized protein TCM_038033 [Theobroma cacao]